MEKITVAYGDGIGPEIMESTLEVLSSAKAKIEIETIDIGQKQFERGHSTGIPPEAWKTIKKNNIILKAPITTPQGGGYKSLNVTLRKTLGLYANVRPNLAYDPIVKSNSPNMDLVIVRENEESLYAGIEHRQTPNTYQCLKLVTRTGCERIVRYAFDYAIKNSRKKITCMTKDNIMKMTDGLLHKVFDEVSLQYPEIETEHYIVDIGAARLATRPEIFDVIVTENLYGDILSDIVAEVSGSVGLAGSSNIGNKYAMFEAIHGSAPDIAGKNIANPSGLINASVMMLTHLNLYEEANIIHNAWLKTIEDGIHTIDVYSENSKKKVSTKEFTKELISRFGETPNKFKAKNYQRTEHKEVKEEDINKEEINKTLVGVDVFVNWMGDVNELAEKINNCTNNTKLKLQMIGSRGLKIWPDNTEVETSFIDHWRMRFLPLGEDKIASHKDIIEVLECLVNNGIDFIKTENLCLFNGELGFTLAQGQ